MQHIPIIDVVLCTFNGERYLGTFLDSLVSQRNVRVHLFVSDDLSQDKTLAILNSYAEEFEVFDCTVNESRLGPKDNFFQTLKRTKSRLVAFADQDDVWEEDKLSKLAKLFSSDAITAAHSNLVTTNNLEYDLNSYDLENALWRNRIPGCTLMINRDVASLLSRVNPNKVIMHDWAAIIVALSLGRISKLPETLVRYRLHENNYVGMPSKFIRLKNFILQIFHLKKSPKILDQAAELQRVLMESGNIQNSVLIERMLLLGNRPFIYRIGFCFRYILASSTEKNLFVVLRVLAKSF